MQFAVSDGRLGVIADASLHLVEVPLGPDPLLTALIQGLDLTEIGRSAIRAGSPLPIPERLDPPIAKPSKIIAIGLNYRDHCREAGLDPPESPVSFSKHPSSIIGTGHPIPLDATISEQVDYEVELAVIIGERCSDLDEKESLDVVAGYTIANDVSARDVQFNEHQWVRAKSFDGFCPVGPVMVTADDIADPQALAMRTEVSGESLQDSSTAEMLFPVRTLLAHISRRTTLLPGDLILTGTPWGTGAFRLPPRFLKDGDTVCCSIERLGTLSNPVIAAPPVSTRTAS
jgi:2-keto-4-pentenoate hydratase/2-oxohepta-3-ene-1,7-dioic acid hydratase in catechol pathway